MTSVIEFAILAHDGQRRKYTNEPYIVHPCRVAATCSSIMCNPETIAAAWLHDVVEDCDVTIDDIECKFGWDVASMVYDLSDLLTPADGNRDFRKQKYTERIAAADSRVKTVKLADIIDNTPDICQHDPDFGIVYLKEIEKEMEVLHEGNPDLYHTARYLIDKEKYQLSLVRDKK